MFESVRTIRSKATLASVAVLLVWSCSSSTTGAGTPASAVALDPTESTLVSVNEQVTLTATALDENGDPISGKTFAWSSSDDAVASVNASGTVTARANGTATITATVDGVSSTSTIVVSQVPAGFIFQRQPIGTPVDSIFNVVQILIADANGKPVTAATEDVTVALNGGPGGATLSGTTTRTAVAGVANFDDLSVDVLGSGYTLDATLATVAAVSSDAFDITLAFTTISSGASSTCGLIATGVAYCWGTGDDGRLGTGNNASVGLPTLVTDGHTFTDLEVGGDGACGLVGTDIYCWGSNVFGQLGDGSTVISSATPVMVSGGHLFTAVTVSSHRCGITSVGAYCWGNGFSGQLGNGTKANSGTPVLVSGGESWTAISAGGQHTCGIIANGDGRCWGLNSQGQLGTGVFNLGFNTPQAMAPVRTWTSMSAGRAHSCGISTASTALQYCWGNNLDGELGNGLAPLPSAQASGIQGLTFAQIEAGSRSHTCGVDASGIAYCWGAGRVGQLGNGGTGDQFNPRAVATLGAPNTYQFLTAGSFHSCGIATNGGAHCWGQDLEGSLGHPGVISATTPVPVGAPSP